MVKEWHLCSGVTGHVNLQGLGERHSAVPRCCQKVAERLCKHSRPGSWWWKWLSLETGELVRNGKFLELFLKAPCCAAKPLKIVMFCQSICWERELFFQQAVWFNFHFSRRDFKQMFIECLLCRHRRDKDERGRTRFYPLSSCLAGRRWQMRQIQNAVRRAPWSASGK